VSRSYPKPQLLVVDDDFAMTNVLKELLSDCDFEVDVAYDGLQALSKIKAKTYDAIICDYQMPRMNGQVLFETLQRTHPGIASRFIFVTANARVPEVTQFLNMMRLPHLDKPFRSAEVVHLVEKVLQASKN
jgi:CheY-like chemotaxis protein